MRKQSCCGSSVLAVGHLTVGVPPHAADQFGQLIEYDAAADDLVIELVFGEIMRIEEVSERAVAHVVQQGRHSHERLDIAAAGHVGADLVEALVGLLDHAACQVHRAEHVLEAGVLGRRIDQPGGLQLVDLAQPLNPGIVDDRLFGDFTFGQSMRRDEGDVAVDNVVAETGVQKRVHAGIIQCRRKPSTARRSGRRPCRTSRRRRSWPAASGPCHRRKGR